MFDKIRNKLFERQLYADLGHQKRTIVRSINKLENIGIVYTEGNSDQDEQVRDFASFLKKRNKEFQILAFQNIKRKGNEEIHFQKYCLNDINWIGVPTASNVKDFCSRGLDLLVVLNPENFGHKNYILALSSAKIKAGIKTDHESPNFYDFIVEQGKKGPIQLSDIFSQLEKLSSHV